MHAHTHTHHNWAGLRGGGWQSCARNTYTVYFSTLTVGMATSNFSLFSNSSLSLSLPSHFLSNLPICSSPSFPQFNLPAPIFFPLICSFFFLWPSFLCFTSIRLSECHLTTITLGFSSTDGILCWMTAATQEMHMKPWEKTQNGRTECAEKEKSG